MLEADYAEKIFFILKINCLCKGQYAQHGQNSVDAKSIFIFIVYEMRN